MSNTQQKRYFGTDGIRGKVGQGAITPEFILRLGWAVGRTFRQHSGRKPLIMIGKDTRLSGYMFESALESGLSAAGADVALLGPMPTPAIAYLTRTFRASAGIVISASHNPYDDNGIKFFGSNGQKISDELELAIENEIEHAFKKIDSGSLGRATRIADAGGRYIEFCKSSFDRELSMRGLRVAIDCAHGATYHLAPDVFKELGAEVFTCGTEPDGLNINKDVGSTSMGQLKKLVADVRADIGIAYDGDGDRVMLMTNTGEIIDGDQILYVLATQLGSDFQRIPGVVGTLMSNFGLEQALRSKGIDFCRANVGDRYVMEMLREKGWMLVGESSGHIVCLDKTTTGDGIISSLQVVKALIRGERSLADAVSGMVKTPMEMINVKYGEGKDPLNDENVQKAVKSAEAALGKEGRVLLRKSGTEPLVRVMVEGTDHKQVHQYVREIAEVVEKAVE
ncbi:MAG TPA: phosphoglucosamine mutase [Gammaproteobacteria bacterium]|nr:phosphoglucosamine mutase [Gammaproteobacteria bacterium]